MSRFTARNNGEWDRNSLEGPLEPGIVCHTCGEIVPITYQKSSCHTIYDHCGNCFNGDKETALKSWLGG